jgi:hypothetical protein
MYHQCEHSYGHIHISITAVYFNVGDIKCQGYVQKRIFFGMSFLDLSTEVEYSTVLQCTVTLSVMLY